MTSKKTTQNLFSLFKADKKLFVCESFENLVFFMHLNPLSNCSIGVDNGSFDHKMVRKKGYFRLTVRLFFPLTIIHHILTSPQLIDV